MALFLDAVSRACGLRPAVHLPTVGESPRGPTVLEPRPAYVHYKYAGRVIMASAVYNTLARDHSPGLSTMSASVPVPGHPRNQSRIRVLGCPIRARTVNFRAPPLRRPGQRQFLRRRARSPPGLRQVCGRLRPLSLLCRKPAAPNTS